jgi:hypothetical protein
MTLVNGTVAAANSLDGQARHAEAAPVHLLSQVSWLFYLWPELFSHELGVWTTVLRFVVVEPAVCD